MTAPSSRGGRGKLVPFGKYKGQPVELLAADRDYCDWLMGQPWFADRFRDVYNVVINYGGEPQDTPEHNALQARFLDDEFCMRLARLVAPECFAVDAKVQDASARAKAEVQAQLTYARECLVEAEKELSGVSDERFRSWHERKVEEARSRVERIEAGEVWLHKEPFKIAEVEFESHGWDVIARFSGNLEVSIVGYERLGFYKYLGDIERRYFWGYSLHHRIGCIQVEAKPTVGDNYPSILRQIKGYRYRYDGRRILLIGQFQAKGATFEQIKKIFASSGITVVMLAEIDAAPRESVDLP